MVHKISKKKSVLLQQHGIIGWLLINQLRNDRWLADGKPWQMNILHGSPHNGETRCFSGKGINLICPLSHEARKSFQWHWSCECSDVYCLPLLTGGWVHEIGNERVNERLSQWLAKVTSEQVSV